MNIERPKKVNMAIKALFDVNVFLDFFLQRNPDASKLNYIFTLIDKKEIEGFTTISILLYCRYSVLKFSLEDIKLHWIELIFFYRPYLRLLKYLNLIPLPGNKLPGYNIGHARPDAQSDRPNGISTFPTNPHFDSCFLIFTLASRFSALSSWL